MPSTETSPRPWRVAEYPKCPGLADVFDASGSPSGLVAGEINPADAALIVAAVNAIDATKKLSIKLYDPIRRAEAERDRLRDLVRRMIGKLAALNDGYALLLRTTPDADMAELCGEVYELVREARAALGEGETPTGKGERV